MKKVIILAIALIYVASIAIVNFFGLQEKGFEETIYVDRITLNAITIHKVNGDEDLITTDDARVKVTKEKQFFFSFDFVPPAEGTEFTADNIEMNDNQVVLDFTVSPNNAQEKKVDFEYDREAYEDIALFYPSQGIIVFLKPGMVTLTLRAVDGSKKATTFQIYAK